MHRGASFALVAATVGVMGCGLSERDVTFAELAPSVRLSDDGFLAFAPASGGSWNDDCPVLPSTTTGTLDGIAADEVSRGGVYHGAEGSEGCTGLAFRWYDPAPSPAGPSTFITTDGTTTWTFVVWHPFDQRDFTLVSHPAGQIHAGDRVVGQSNIAEDGPLMPFWLVRVATFDKKFFYPKEPDVVFDLHTLSFTMPAEAAAGDTELWLEARATMRIDQCDAPAGCSSEARAITISHVDIVP